jgi:hypothetical protein
MSFKSIAEQESMREQLAAVFSAGIDRWLDLGSRLAVASSDPDKLKMLNERLDAFHESFVKSSFGGIGKALVSEKIVDNCDELKTIDHHTLKRLMPHQTLLHRIDSLRMYVQDRMNRMKIFLDADQNQYKIHSEYDLIKLYNGLHDSLVNCQMKPMCALYANEAACIGRNLKNVNGLQHKTELENKCKEILRKSLIRSKSL